MSEVDAIQIQSCETHGAGPYVCYCQVAALAESADGFWGRMAANALRLRDEARADRDACSRRRHENEEALIAKLEEAQKVLVQAGEKAGELWLKLEEARATNARLNRRCQLYEAGLAEKVKQHREGGWSFGRMLANSAAVMAERKNDELATRISVLEETVRDLIAAAAPGSPETDAAIATARAVLTPRSTEESK